MSGYLTKRDELNFTRTDAEIQRSKKFYYENRLKVLARVKNNRDSKKVIVAELIAPITVVNTIDPRDIII